MLQCHRSHQPSISIAVNYFAGFNTRLIRYSCVYITPNMISPHLVWITLAWFCARFDITHNPRASPYTLLLGSLSSRRPWPRRASCLHIYIYIYIYIYVYIYIYIHIYIYIYIAPALAGIQELYEALEDQQTTPCWLVLPPIIWRVGLPPRFSLRLVVSPTLIRAHCGSTCLELWYTADTQN